MKWMTLPGKDDAAVTARPLVALALVLAGLLPVACGSPPPQGAVAAAAPKAAAPAAPAPAAPAAPEPAAPAPAETAPVSPAPPPGRWVLQHDYGPLVSDDPAARDRKVVLLTFDDGPHPVYTPRILDTLREYNVRALWFVTANAGKYPDLLRRIAAEGHRIGTHTLNHENLRSLDRDGQRRAIVGVNEMVARITGIKPRYFRPPYGAFNADTRAVLAELGMTLMNWDHGSGDWMDLQDGYKDPQVVIQDTLSERPRNPRLTALHPGAIILFHDTHKHTAEALPAIIRGLREKGYEFILPEP